MASLAEVKEKVQMYLTDFVGQVDLGKDGMLSFPFESTRVFVKTSSNENNDSAHVMIWAFISVAAPVSPAMYEWVALNTGAYTFGHIECIPLADEDGRANIVFSHTLLGDYLDAEELRRAVGAVAYTADQLDDTFVAEFGGRRFNDD